MLDSFELFLLGFACVIDTVLILVIFERINHSQVAVWLKLLIGGIWLVHVSSFFHLMLKPVEGSIGVLLDHSCMTLISVGLLVLPSAMLHAAIRLSHSGIVTHPKADGRYCILYLPLLLTCTTAWLVFHDQDRDFIQSVNSISWLYIGWILTANVASAFLFWRLQTRIPAPGALSFFRRLSIAILAITGLASVYVLWGMETKWEFPLRLLAIMSPLIPSLLFVWYILRQRLLPLVIERTFVYGAFLATMLLLHRITITPWTSEMGDRSNLDFVLIEWILIFGLVMSWRPLRERVRTSLRYLLSNDVFQIRDATRQLSVQLSQQTERTPEELIEWFSKAVQERIAVDFAKIIFFDTPVVTAVRTESNPKAFLCSQELRCLKGALENMSTGFFYRGEIDEPTICAAMEQLNADSIFRICFRSVNGLAILGPRLRSDRLADEQMTALAMLFDQFAATLFNRELEMQRLRAERQSMQQEKLSVLGLIAGSLAHELRNPLSSIRTIATLMKEDMPEGDEHFRDISMIVCEIDRLSQTTQRLLDYAKPNDTSSERVVPDRVIERLLHILGQLARQHSVEIVQNLTAGEANIVATDATLSEILFNLIRNAIEAAREVPQGRVTIASKFDKNLIAISVTDNGHGIDPSVRESIFQPFVTQKIDGTGLGLYIAAERVRELSGTLHCESLVGQGSVFEVRLPVTNGTIKS